MILTHLDSLFLCDVFSVRFQFRKDTWTSHTHWLRGVIDDSAELLTPRISLCEFEYLREVLDTAECDSYAWWRFLNVQNNPRCYSHCLCRLQKVIKAAVSESTVKKNLYLFRKSRLSRSYLPTQVPFWRKKFKLLPLPYLWSSARAVHLIILILTDSCLPKQHLPSNWITNEENCYYPNSLLPVNFGISA